MNRLNLSLPLNDLYFVHVITDIFTRWCVCACACACVCVCAIASSCNHCINTISVHSFGWRWPAQEHHWNRLLWYLTVTPEGFLRRSAQSYNAGVWMGVPLVMFQKLYNSVLGQLAALPNANFTQVVFSVNYHYQYHIDSIAVKRQLRLWTLYK